ncbi:MAG: LamG-like jellyroll fold domain-containing protein, partial [Planctomycetota bacterium]
SWDAPAERVSGFAVFRASAEGWVRASGEEPVRGTEATIAGLPEGEPCRFAVRSVDRAGRLGEPSSEVSATPLAVPEGPVFEARFDSTRAETGGEGRLAGKAKVQDGVLDVSEGGWIEYPGSELLQVGGPISIELWARVRRIEGIPVLLAFGHWEGPGYWLQLIGGKIRFYLPVQKHLDAGSLPAGAWHHIAATYDGTTSRLYVDGEEVGSAAIGPVSLEPWRGPLRIGMYSDIDAQFQTLGELDDVRIFQRALAREEVRRSFEAKRAAR